MAPTHGTLLPPFSLPKADGGGQVSLWDYKPRRNLALLFLRDVSEHAPLLRAIAEHLPDYRELNAVILVIVSEAERASAAPNGFPFPILLDRDGELRRKCAGTAAESQPLAIIADRWGEVYGKMILQPHLAAADEQELRNWLQFVDQQCGECFPPEWPAIAQDL